VYLATTYNIISQGLSAGTVSGVGNRVEERNERLVDAVEEVVDGGERDVRVCYGVMHAEGIDRGMRKKGWRRGEDGTLEVRPSEERRTAGRRAGAKRQLVLYLTDPLLASLATPLLVASLLARFAHRRYLNLEGRRKRRGRTRRAGFPRST